ncbi:DUF5590 domain-containing protein [Planococcus shenhongbingii]|uniref:cell wall elongation regulator TseB-like domain-containing protein n=1 Tax=Planococcus shenhongbingii TaxID=3058398 RepID=UPI00262BEA34|nr:DUF5590 domain-containing protein [Planococcus sp. N016]WKA57207.1 DUF5590 domain-containing protein [Planococcus sp. N016]
MKQWITFILGFLSFLAVALMIAVIVAGNKPYSEVEKQAIERVENDFLLEDIQQAYVYSNKQTSVTVIGTDSKGALKAVFVPAGKGELKTVPLEGAVTPQQAREIALADKDIKEILHTKLGMESKGPVWEIAYVNKQDQLNYIYILANDGTTWKQILNL